MNLHALRKRLDALAAKIPPAPLVVKVPPEEPEHRYPEDVERALMAELFRQRDALAEAAAGLSGFPSNPFHFTKRNFADLDRAGRIKPHLAKQMLVVGRALDRDGLFVVRRADGRLSPEDARAKRGATAQGQPVCVLPYVAPLEHMGIDIKAEMLRDAQQGVAA